MEPVLNPVVSKWYGLKRMPIRVLEEFEERREFEGSRSYCVDHARRQLYLWKNCHMYDIVVYDPYSNRFKMIQTLHPKLAYPTMDEWHDAILSTLQDKDAQFWFVIHDD
jgi:hypothetical protein